MSYNFTEKKRIRKSFAKKTSVLDIPYLLETQLTSYKEFLQKEVPAEERRNEGLQAAFESVFPITSHNGFAKLDFVEFALGTSMFDVRECQQRGLTYASPLRAKVRLILMDREASKPTIKEVKEQEVYMGEIPLITDNGSFVINGTERVIVSQLHRSPGVFFEHDKGKTHSSGKLLFSARVIPYRGSWLDFEFDPKDFLYFRIDRRRKMPITILLKALGYSDDEILAEFFGFDDFAFIKDSIEMNLVVERLRGEIARFDIKDKNGNLIVGKDKRINAKHLKDIKNAKINKIVVPPDFLLGRVVAETIVNNETGEIIVKANEEISEDHLVAFKSENIKAIKTIYVNDLDHGSYVSATLRTDDTPDRLAARVAIYRMM